MKAKIIQIGLVENGTPRGWSFESYTAIPALNTSGMGTLYYGYTIKELEEIRKTRTSVIDLLDAAA